MDISDPQMGELVHPRSYAEYENRLATQFPCFVGIDPGKRGGIAIIRTDGELLTYQAMGEAYELAAFLSDRKIVRCYVEKCQAMPSQGVKSMFTYGTGYGKILGVLETLKISYDLVQPQKWQRKMIPGTKKGETKKAALAKARQLFPHESFIPDRCRTAHDGIVDAVLIAEYGRGLHV
jgi:crossover junction endodeoxyribonuclease RuvC